MLPSRALPIALIVAVILSGCVDEPVDEPDENEGDEGQDLPSLEDLTECHWPDRKQKECINEANEVEPVNVTAFPGGECLVEVPGEVVGAGARLYRTDDGASLLRYEVPSSHSPALVSGIVAVQDGNRSTYYNWNFGDDEAFLELPAIRAGTNVSLLVFRNEHMADAEAIQNGTFRVDWAIIKITPSPWPIRVLAVDDEEYFFQNAWRYEDEAFLWQWDERMEFKGKDFQIFIHYVRLINGSVQVPEAGAGEC